MVRRKKQKKWKAYCKTGSRYGNRSGKKRRHQKGGLLNRYDFAYAGGDTVNQVGKIALEIITQATEETDKIAQNRINQVIRSGGAEIE